MGPLGISGTTSRLDCSRQLRRCILGHTFVDVKPGGGMNTWKRSLLPSGKLSMPGRLVKAPGHHMMQPNEMPNMQCTMLFKKPTRTSMRILTSSLQKSTPLLTSLEERTLMLLVKTCEEWYKRDVSEWRHKAEGLARALPKASQRWVTGTQTTCHINHQWKARPSQSPLIWLRRLSHRWRLAKHRAHQV